MKLLRNAINARPIVKIVLAGCVFSLPVLLYGFPFLSDDSVTHSLWYSHFSQQLWAGDLYPRWLPGMNNGLGSPAFFYYPPAPYFFISLLKPLFANDPQGWRQLGIAASLALSASGLCAYLWLKELTERTSAFIAAVLYMAMPYHLTADLYMRGLVPEFWAFIWMPLILYFVHKIVSGHRLAVAGLAVSYALLIMTHLPTTLIFSVIPPVYVFWATNARPKLKFLGIVVAGMACGIGLSMIYLWPAMTTQQYVFIDRMTTGYFSFENWLFFSHFSLWRDDKLLILLLLFDLCALAVCAFLIARADLTQSARRLSAFWLTTAIASVLMMTELSKPIWLLFSPLQKIQFPWRFSAVLTVAVTALLALAIARMRKSKLFPLRLNKTVALLLIVGWLPATVWAAWNAYPHGNEDQQELGYRNRMLAHSRDAPEYRPRWSSSMNDLNWELSKEEDDPVPVWNTQLENEIESLLQRVGKTDAGTLQINIVDGTGDANILSWKPREISLQTKTATGMRISLSQFYYPNWTAHLVGEQGNLNVQPLEPDGLLSVSVPAGEHQILLRLERSRAELIGQVVSLISGLCVLLYVAVVLVKVRRQKSRLIAVEQES